MSVFRLELTLHISTLFCGAYVSTGIVFFLSNFSTYLEPVRRNHYVMSILSSLMSIFVIINFLATLTNLRVNYTYRNFRDKGTPENPTIVYLMCLPLLVAAMMAFLYILLCDIYYIHCKGPTEVVLGSTLAVIYVSMIILLLDTNGIVDTGESWTLNFSNCFAIALSIITLFFISCFNMLLIHVFQFIEVQKQYFPRTTFNSCSRDYFPAGSTGALLHSNLRDFIPYYQTCILILSVTFIAYFLVPLERNYSALQSVLSDAYREEAPLLSSEASLTGRTLSSLDVFANVILAVGLLLAKVALFVQQENVRLAYHQILPSVQLLLMLAVVAVLLSDLRPWSCLPSRRDSISFHQVILWLGVVAEVSLCVSSIVLTLGRLHKETTDLFKGMILLRNGLQLLQVFTQTVVMAMILQRQKTSGISRQMRIFNILNPFLVLAVLNIVFLICQFISKRSPWSKNDDLWNNIFVDSIDVFTVPLILLYRFFCALWLLKLL